VDKRITIEIFYVEAGGGHLSALRALKEILSLRHPYWNVRPVDLQKVLEPVDPLHKISVKLSPSINRLLNINGAHPFRPLRAQDFYNLVVKSGGSRGFDRMRPLVQEGIRKRFPLIEALLRNRWAKEAQSPDLVISVIPNFNGVLFRALRSVCCSAPFLTVMTDLQEREPGFWMEDQNQIIVCGSPKAAARARACGYYAAESIFHVSGMLLRPAFYAPPKFPRKREDIGLAPCKPTALISFGGNGSMTAKSIVERLEKANLDMQSIVLCGKDKRLFEKLRHKRNCRPVGFSENVADYMRLADFMIGKPGPGSLSEALHLGLPVIVESNAATLPQEKPNVDWIVENGVGLAVSKFAPHIAAAAAYMREHLDDYKRNIRLTIPPNRALFETADVIEDVLQSAGWHNPVYSASSSSAAGCFASTR